MCTSLCGEECREGAPHISQGGARGNVQQGCSGQRREEIPEHRLISSSPLCISGIWLLDGLAVARTVLAGCTSVGLPIKLLVAPVLATGSSSIS
jgi:hypothetical protein